MDAFAHLFRERGLPSAIRGDTGLPFASPNGLTPSPSSRFSDSGSACRSSASGPDAADDLFPRHERHAREERSVECRQAYLFQSRLWQIAICRKPTSRMTSSTACVPSLWSASRVLMLIRLRPRCAAALPTGLLAGSLQFSGVSKMVWSSCHRRSAYRSGAVLFRMSVGTVDCDGQRCDWLFPRAISLVVNAGQPDTR